PTCGWGRTDARADERRRPPSHRTSRRAGPGPRRPGGGARRRARRPAGPAGRRAAAPGRGLLPGGGRPLRRRADGHRRHGPRVRPAGRGEPAAVPADREAGIRVLPWTGPGQPYRDSRDLIARVRATGLLHVFLTRHGHGPAGADGDHPLRAPAGVRAGGEELLHNDIFRAVHDVFGHVLFGNTFGPRGYFRVHPGPPAATSRCTRPTCTRWSSPSWSASSAGSSTGRTCAARTGRCPGAASPGTCRRHGVRTRRRNSSCTTGAP
ncbi:LOW QUALITY PROTEIN: hypothetical protein MCBG_01948, partial [Micromonospora sp. M42]